MWTPTTHQDNWRVEVTFTGIQASWRTEVSLMSEKDAKRLAEYVTQLKGISARPVCDVWYECPNCVAIAKTVEDLKGCCECSG